MVGLIIAIILAFFNSWPSVLLLLLYPSLGIVIMAKNKGLIKFLTNSYRSVKQHVEIGILLPVLLLFYKSLAELNILPHNKLWIAIIVATALLFFSFYRAGINRSIGQENVQTVVIFVVALTYAFGSIRLINCAFDNSSPKIYSSTIVSHRLASGKGMSYFLTLGPWGPIRDEKELEVHQSVYDYFEINDTAKIHLRKGLLGAPWFTIEK